MSQPTRLSLIEEIQANQSDDAWRDFCAIYDGLIQGWLARQGVQPADADDVRQESMATVFKEIGSFEHSGRTGAFRRWLRNIVSNRLRRLWDKKSNQRKKEGVELSVLADQLADDSSRLSAVWDHEHDIYVIDKILDSLTNQFPQQSIRVFRKVAIQGENDRQIADELGITLGALRVAKHRVLKAVKQAAGALLI